ncbi:MAG: hypothetical protein B6D68_01150 [spirochete symbiont of Stewartia floridana]|nr:MAG: hypothetical protein B6D68_01150 [spirochete symbiont of Stewartia floridana]
MIMHRIRAAVLLAMVSLNCGAAEWYRSGPEGYLGKSIDSGGKAGLGWTMAVEIAEGVETRTLHQGDKIHSVAVITRVDEQLVSWVEKDAEGTLISKVEYVYNSEGTPQAVYIAPARDAPIVVGSQSLIQADGPVFRSIYGEDDDWVFTDMNEVGLPFKQTTYQDGEVVETWEWMRSEDGRLLQTTAVRGEITDFSQYDSQEHLTLEQRTKNGVLLYSRVYTWDGEDIIRIDEHGDGKVLRQEIEWSEGNKSREVFYDNNLKTKEIVWTAPGKKTETIYRDGSPSVRVYWVDDRPIREEFLSEGRIIRVLGSRQ